MITVLLTGGLGFIGSHIAVELLNAGHQVVIVDNLSNSDLSVYKNILQITQKSKEDCRLYSYDLTDKSKCEAIFFQHRFHSVIHCAGLKAVNESIRKPLRYYSENLQITLNLLDLISRFDINHFVFSSSATVYGTQNSPFKESDQTGIGISNPYGQTKHFQEQIIRDFAKCNPYKTLLLLRYFNPVGAHESGLIGEDPKGHPNNLMPYILRVAGQKPGYTKLTIFGDDYDTPDGTCLRDFIHVVDLARAHLMSIKYEIPGVTAINLGTGNGVSVKELVDQFKSVNKVDFTVEIGDRREGDLAVVTCNCDKAMEVLGWKAEKSVQDMVRDSYNYVRSDLTK